MLIRSFNVHLRVVIDEVFDFLVGDQRINLEKEKSDLILLFFNDLIVLSLSLQVRNISQDDGEERDTKEF